MAELLYIQELDSTNNYLKTLEGKDFLADGSIVYTDFQLAGRGQRGNYWESECAQNLLFSVIVHPRHIHPATHFIISQTIALAVVQVLDRYVDGCSIKWPNDIYYGNKKLGGILIENELNGECIANSVIGVGLNVNQTVFTSNAPNPVSLKNIINENIDREVLLKEIQQDFIALYHSVEADRTVVEKSYKQRLFRKEGYHKYRDCLGCEFEARIKDVEPNGILVLELKNFQIYRFAFKEIVYVL